MLSSVTILILFVSHLSERNREEASKLVKQIILQNFSLKNYCCCRRLWQANIFGAYMASFDLIELFAELESYYGVYGDYINFFFSLQTKIKRPKQYERTPAFSYSPKSNFNSKQENVGVASHGYSSTKNKRWNLNNSVTLQTVLS